MPSNAFWASPKVEPKRKFKFLAFIGDIPPFVLKTVTLPAKSVTKTEVYWLNHTFKYTGRAQYEDLQLEFVDSEQVNVLGLLNELMEQSGYMFPTSPSQLNTISKAGAVGALGDVVIQQLTHENKILEEWKFVNAWVSKIDPGNRDYSSDDAATCSVTVVFDWYDVTIHDLNNLPEASLS